MTSYQFELSKLRSFVKNRQWTLYLLNLYKFIQHYTFPKVEFSDIMVLDDLAQVQEEANSFWANDNIALRGSGYSGDNNSTDISTLRKSIRATDTAGIEKDGYMFLYIGNYYNPSRKWKFPKNISLLQLFGDGINPPARISARELFYRENKIDEKSKFVLVQQMYSNINVSDRIRICMTLGLLIDRIKLATDMKNFVVYIEDFENSTDDVKKEFLTQLIIEIISNYFEKEISFENLVIDFESETEEKLFTSILSEILELISLQSNLLVKYQEIINQYYQKPRKESEFELPKIIPITEPAIIFRRKFSPNCDKLDDMFVHLHAIKDTDESVLFMGETGSGKGSLAELLHNESIRSNFPFFEVNCSSITKEIVESTLFGHQKGSFTGAIEDKKGYFELADKGTLFLDEVGDAIPEVQQALLKVLDKKKFRRLGGSEEISVDVRIVFATNKDLKKLINMGFFREDLYRRMEKHIFKLRPLRDRMEDIPSIVDSLKIAYEKNDKPYFTITEDFINELKKYNWPGNFREFKNFIERILIICKAKNINIIDAKIAKEKIPSDITIKGKFKLSDLEEPITDLFKNWFHIRENVSADVEKQLRNITGKKPILNQLSFGRSVIEPLLAKIYLKEYESMGLDQGDGSETIGLSWKGAKGESPLLQKSQLYSVVEKYF